MEALVEENMVTANHTPRVCVSILSWKNSAETINCINSLRKNTLIDYEIIVLDNESTPATLSALQALTDITIISSAINLGFAGGHNRIMAWALEHDFDYVWLLNNDATCQENCLARLVDYAENNYDCALISPVLLDNLPPHGVQHVISILNDTKTGSHEYTNISVAKEMQDAYPNKVIIWGTALLVRLSCIKKLGFLDEDLFAYAEDTDYALRSISCGYRNSIVFDAYVWHENPPHPRKPHYYYYTHRNSVAIAKKYASRINTMKIIYWNLRLAKKQLKAIEADSETSNALRLGIWHGWLNHDGQFIKESKISIFGNLFVRLLLHLA